MQFEPMELEPIKAGQERLSRVFSDEFAFAIPTYQRPYAWEKEQAEALLADILAALDEAIETKAPVTYFLGSIVLIKQPGAPEAKVVDGQQRLTTLTILLSVLRDLSSLEVGIKRHAYICEEGDPDKGTKSRYRLTLRKRDEEFFRATVQNKGATNALPGTKGLTDSRLRIVENATLFHDRAKAMTPEARDRLVAFLLQRCYLVVIAVANVDMAHRVFTVLNARGLDLTPADILKADLLDRVAAADEKDYSDSWEAIEEQLGRDRFAELFQHIRMIYQREKPRERLEVGFKKFVTDFADHAKFMKGVLQPFGATFAKLLSPPAFATLYGDEATKRLRYLTKLDNNDWMPVALKFFVDTNISAGDAALFMRRLETLAYFLFVTRADINERIRRYANVLTDLVGGEWKGRSIELAAQDKAAFRADLDGPIYQVTRVRLPLLLRLDAELSSGGATYSHDIVSVEHVLPQTPEAASQWLKDFPDDAIRNGWTHKLANLVLLTLRKNIQASNWDFSTKKNRYFSESGGVSPFVITTQVLGEQSWTPTVLEARQRALLAKLHTTWDIAPEAQS
ncbi:DUF262 domain-containing protein [Prosthecodimorpha staleyi]|uniref:DUF262 domain-containing HNH endonuclease family protein n=1 Tax=Prosthecodimorpha staleyi TaxID=2840188 RepID=A0A947D445_9HYPH|nr:DUF262 domain-containing HNH endonuclease family protein [Prosthecodimorpha staleyi]MBT9290670.1 DUF262 domain-containing HNH endonuclease family protein [Prosthecodimorpha staleyi]